MRTMVQPGAVLSPRRLSGTADITANLRLFIPQGQDLLNGMLRALVDQGIHHAAISLISGTFETVDYLTGQVDETGERVATYGPPTRLAGPVQLLGGNAIVGVNPEDQPLIHCHAVMVDRNGQLHGGHLPPGTSRLSGEGAVALVAAFTGGGFKVAYDSETNYPIFHPLDGAGEVRQ